MDHIYTMGSIISFLFVRAVSGRGTGSTTKASGAGTFKSIGHDNETNPAADGGESESRSLRIGRQSAVDLPRHQLPSNRILSTFVTG
jgi:hypothetical protein